MAHLVVARPYIEKKKKGHSASLACKVKEVRWSNAPG